MSIVTEPLDSTSPVAPTDPMGDSVATKKVPSGRLPLWRLLLRDKLATVASVILGIVLFTAVFGPWLVGDAATEQNLDGPGSTGRGSAR